MNRSKVVALAALVMLASTLAAFLLLRPGEVATTYYGVRLGDPLAVTRARFQPGAPGGTWTSETAPAPVLTWTPAQPGAVRHARFEFHQGLLVAARFTLAKTAPEASGPALALTRASVVSRRGEGDGVTLTVLSRDCPDHAAEVRALVGSP